MDLMLVSNSPMPPPLKVTHRGAGQSRALTRKEGKLKRREILRGFRKWNAKIERDVSNLEDFELLTVVAFLLDSDPDAGNLTLFFGKIVDPIL